MLWAMSSASPRRAALKYSDTTLTAEIPYVRIFDGFRQ